MIEQLRLFDGSETKPDWQHVELIDYAEAGYNLGREFNNIPHIDLDFEKLPSIPEVQKAFANSTPINLIDTEGNPHCFYALFDLDHNGWLNDPTIQPPSFVFYEGAIIDEPIPEDHDFERRIQTLNEPHVDHWLLLIEPGGNIDGTDAFSFGWHGDILQFA